MCFVPADLEARPRALPPYLTNTLHAPPKLHCGLTPAKSAPNPGGLRNNSGYRCIALHCADPKLAIQEL